jgi:hypothetical protein
MDKRSDVAGRSGRGTPGFAELASQRARAAALIDPRTCHFTWWYVDVLDIYGDDPDPQRETNIGRGYFVSDPDGGPWICEHHVRSLNPQITDVEWSRLMKLASARADVTLRRRLATDSEFRDLASELYRGTLQYVLEATTSGSDDRGLREQEVASGVSWPEDGRRRDG